MRKTLATIILIIGLLTFVGCSPEESKAPANWCRDDVFDWFGCDYPRHEILAYTMNRLSVVAETGEELGIRFEAYIIEIFYDDGSVCSKIYLSTIYYSTNAWQRTLFKTPQIKKSQVLDLDTEAL